MWLTLWARRTLDLPEALRPIPLEAFGAFWDSLFREAGAATRTIAAQHHEAFRRWLARRANQDPAAVAQSVGPVLVSLLSELEEDYGRVARTAIDPRYIKHFLLENAAAGGLQA